MDIPQALELDHFMPIVGVYFVYLDDTVIYVGQSTNIRVRIASHLKNWPWIKRVSYLIVPPEELNRVEAYWIRRLQPECNRTIRTVAQVSN